MSGADSAIAAAATSDAAVPAAPVRGWWPVPTGLAPPPAGGTHGHRGKKPPCRDPANAPPPAQRGGHVRGGGGPRGAVAWSAFAPATGGRGGGGDGSAGAVAASRGDYRGRGGRGRAWGSAAATAAPPALSAASPSSAAFPEVSAPATMYWAVALDADSVALARGGELCSGLAAPSVRPPLPSSPPVAARDAPAPLPALTLKSELHVTLFYAGGRAVAQETEALFASLEGRVCFVRTTHAVRTRRLACAAVAVEDEDVAAASAPFQPFPHVTLALGGSAAARESNDVLRAVQEAAAAAPDPGRAAALLEEWIGPSEVRPVEVFLCGRVVRCTRPTSTPPPSGGEGQAP